METIKTTHSQNSGVHNETFDFFFEKEPISTSIGVETIGELLYADFGHRPDDALIIKGHIASEMQDISLQELRCIVANLFQLFREKDIKSGDCILLPSFEHNNELYLAIFFIALSAFGVEVFMPMYIEKSDVDNWLQKINVDKVILPFKELKAEGGNEQVLSNIEHLMSQAAKRNLVILDSFQDLNIDALVLNRKALLLTEEHHLDVDNCLKSVSSSQLALWITTSGTTGISKLVGYKHRSFISNLSAWKQSGLLTGKTLGACGFTPLFSHTIGIRNLINALYIGKPAILINATYFIEKPEVASYFLSLSKPKHITAGPAVLNMLLELCRSLPQLKSVLRTSLERIVTTGTNVNRQVCDALKDALDVQVYNAFGTTETQQILSGLIGEHAPDSLGGQFPGVAIGLKQCKQGAKLYVQCDYGASYIIDQQKHEVEHKFMYLGDLVHLCNDDLFFIGRERADYMNDEFGVKIPIQKVHVYYEQVFSMFKKTMLYPLKYTPGLGALIICDKAVDTSNKKYLQYITAKLNTINAELFERLEPFEFQHRHLEKWAMISSDGLTNFKGLVVQQLIEDKHAPLIEALTDEYVTNDRVKELDVPNKEENRFTNYHNPIVGKMMRLLKLDISYTKGYGDYLYGNINSKERKILDVTGGYGCNLLGHSNSDLIAHVTSFLNSQKIAISDQLSNQYYPAKLAKKLSDRIARITGKNYVVLFGSTGSEVVEIALLHAYNEWKKELEDLHNKQRRYFAKEFGTYLEEIWENNWKLINGITNTVLINKQAYHGNTLGTKALMGDSERRLMFEPLYGIESVFIDDTAEKLEDHVLQTINNQDFEIQIFNKKGGEVGLESFKVSTIIAAILEPILGEGGIRCIEPKFPELLEGYKFPIVFDEIQSGLGRSGNFLASYKNRGDYYLFSKALGGNICKISAIAIQKDRFVEEFGKQQLSTFSGGGLAASVALKTMNLLDDLQVDNKATDIGEKLINALQQLRTKFPEVIKNITGTGLMVGIKFQDTGEDALLHILSRKKMLGYVLSSYLLHKFNIRILPSISAPNMLRVEPSICFGNSEIKIFCDGIESVANLLQNTNVYELTKHLMDGDGFSDNKGLVPEYGFISGNQEPPSSIARQVVFVGHFTQPCIELRMLSKSLCQASDTGLLKLFHRLVGILHFEPLVLNATNLYNGKIHLTFILLPLDSGMLEKMNRTEKRKDIIKNIQTAVNMAADIGAEYVSLGGYNSIISHNGLTITGSKSLEVITGNTLTAVIGYHNFVSKIRNVFDAFKNLKIGVVGATGNIGRIISERLLHEDCLSIASITIVAKSQKRLDNLKSHLDRINSQSTLLIETSTDLKTLKHCDAVIIAVNTNDAIIHQSFLKASEDVVLVDVSVPTALGKDLLNQPNIHFQNFGASVGLKDDPDVLISSCSPKGTALCCVAEALLCGLHSIKTDLRGEITFESFKIIENHAIDEGFLNVLEQSKPYKPVSL